MPACCGGPRVTAVTGGVFLPGEASSSCSKLDVRTREQKEFGAGTDGSCSAFLFIKARFPLVWSASSNREQKEDPERDESSGSRSSNTGMPTVSYFTMNSQSDVRP
jgi:hypothetical protein